MAPNVVKTKRRDSFLIYSFLPFLGAVLFLLFLLGIIAILLIINKTTKETSQLTDNQQQFVAPAYWKSVSYSTTDSKLVVKLPPEFVVKDEIAGITIANSQKVLNSYLSSPFTFTGKNSSIINISLSDYGTTCPSGRTYVFDCIDSAINMTFGTPHLVSGNTKIATPWKNENGGTDNGEIWYIPDVPYKHLQINGIHAAYLQNDNYAVYYIPAKSGIQFAIFMIKPINAIESKTVQIILHSFELIDTSS